MIRALTFVLAVLMVTACGSPAVSAPTAASVAVQPGDVPNNMHRCSISGDIGSYLNNLKTKDPATYKSTNAEWTDAQSKGVTATQVTFYSDSDANCASVASAVANLSGAAYPLVVNFSVQFKDERARPAATATARSSGSTGRC